MTNFLQNILEQAQAMSWIDWVVTVTAVIYVVMAAREKVWAWFWGIISCSLWAYASFVFYQLYLDAILQLFYVGMGFAGIYLWKFGSREKKELPVSRMKTREHLSVVGLTLVFGLIFGYFFSEYTEAAATYADAFTTVLAVITTYMLVRKKLENWLYWILVDTAYVYLYASRGAYLFAVLMVVYVIIAAYGYVGWRKKVV